MELYESGKEYWEVMSRVRRHEFRPMVVKAAISQLNTLITTTKSDVIRGRAFKAVSMLNHKSSPSNNGGGGGPRYA